MKIIVEQRQRGSNFIAKLLNNANVDIATGLGDSPDEAIGDLVKRHPQTFGIESVEVKPAY